MNHVQVLVAFARGLPGLGARYVQTADGDLRFEGSRPGPDWIGHGWVSRELDGRRVWRHRWLHRLTRQTQLSRSPDELDRLRPAAIVVAVALFAWVAGRVGVYHHRRPRQLQRWLFKALPGAALTLQRVRQVLMERCGPSTLESLFPSGLSPPEEGQRRWKRSSLVWRLHEALFLLLAGAKRLSVQPSNLLTEARERWSVPTSEALI